MKKVENKLDVQKIMRGLKDFQRNTVDYVFHRLYKDEDRVNRFLISDEVGLGKTLVARGVIAKAVEELWDTVESVDIIYICSNADIARQNINRLNITGDRDYAIASRLTMLPIHMHNFNGKKINFISFTPGTSFDLRSKGGVSYERILLYHMLNEGLQLQNAKAAQNVFQGYVTGIEHWRSKIEQFFSNNSIDSGIQKLFIKRIKNDKTLLADFDDLLRRFSRAKKYIPPEDRKKQMSFIGSLRRILAEVCITKLTPDIIIMDEFQRFKDLLDGEDEVARLAQKLFNYKNNEADTKIILLSATPYKMYTMYHEEQDDHYEDFFRTIRFLNESEDKTQNVRTAIKRYRDELIRYTSGDKNALSTEKDRVESALKRYMVRTERLAIDSNRSGMICESPFDICQISSQDIQEFALNDAVAQIVGTPNILEYWKSSSYILNLMDRSSYKVKSNLSDYINENNSHEELVDTFLGREQYLLSWTDIQKYKKIDPRNGRLRTLIKHTIDKELYDLLWIPPSISYYRVKQGPFRECDNKNITKSFVFSAWRVVPKVISQICSYEAERRVIDRANHKYKYDEEVQRRRPLLNFSISNDEYTGLSNFTLIYPCLTLAILTDPLFEGVNISIENEPGVYESIHQHIRAKIEGKLSPILKKYGKGESRYRARWYWLALVLLDRQFYKDIYLHWLDPENNDNNWRDMITGRNNTENESAFADHIEVLFGYFKYDGEDPFLKLGPPPEDLYDVLTEIAIGSPAVAILRSFLRHCGIEQLSEYSFQLLSGSAMTALSFRTLFNWPYSIAVVQKYSKKEYWHAVLDYCNFGNIQAVLDEYTHILKESLGLIDAEKGVIIDALSEEISNALSIRTGNLKFDHFEVNTESKQIHMEAHTLRCRFALNFGESENDEGEKNRPDQVRKAFNSPFQPFILSTTSIGQEGLDFHPYCHDVYHWNLPSNPVDMEQREGRIHRYKGHAVRKNCADSVPLEVLKERLHLHTDPWAIIFEYCTQQRSPGINDLVPFWVNECIEKEPKYRICRHVPLLPLSREVQQLAGLKNSIVAYRMVFGQSRQEDLLDYFQKTSESTDFDINELLKYRIDLSP